jgi:Rrf2 family protein
MRRLLMEILRQDSDYAVRALVYLAQNAGEIPVKAKKLAQSQDIPLEFAYKILRRLSQAGLCQTHMGPRGGFSLLLEPEQISLRDVVGAIQGELVVRNCLLDLSSCPRQPSCTVSPKLTDLQEALEKQLDEITLAAILESKTARCR